MHPRRRLRNIIRDTSQLIIDIQWWNDNRTEEKPFDCESLQVRLNLAETAAKQWDAGDIEEAHVTMNKLSEYPSSNH